MVIPPPCFKRSFFCLTVLNILGSLLQHDLASCAAIFTDIAQEFIDHGHTVTCVSIFKASPVAFGTLPLTISLAVFLQHGPVHPRETRANCGPTPNSPSSGGASIPSL